MGLLHHMRQLVRQQLAARAPVRVEAPLREADMRADRYACAPMAAALRAASGSAWIRTASRSAPKRCSKKPRVDRLSGRPLPLKPADPSADILHRGQPPPQAQAWAGAAPVDARRVMAGPPAAWSRVRPAALRLAVANIRFLPLPCSAEAFA